MKFNVRSSITNVYSGVTVSAEEMRVRTEQKVALLRTMGITSNSRVLIVHGGTPEFFQDLYAVWTIGACALVTGEKVTPYEIDNIIDNSPTPVSAVLTKGLEPRTKQSNIVDLDEKHATIKKMQPNPGCGSGLDDEALILFTSGTTGQPKGVVHTHRSLLARTSLNQQFIDRSDCLNTLCILPTHFGHGLIGNCLTTLAYGNNLYLMCNPDIASLLRLKDVINKYHITFFSSVPSAWKIILRNTTESNCRSIKRISLGSAPLSKKMWEDVIRWSGTQNVVNMYGITEAANWIAGAAAVDFDPEDGLIGRMWGGDVAVVDDDGNLRDSGEGELVVATPALMKGYDNQPKLTSSVLKEGWFYTGDQGLLTEGCIYLTGRLKYQINFGGIKIQPEDIDLLLEKHECVLEACAFGMNDEIAGQIVAVALTLNGATAAQKRAELKELKTWCEERFNPDKLPKRWYIVQEIPKTERGKINRSIVAAACKELESQ